MAVKKKRTPQQIGKSSRQKGARGEREVVNALKKAFPDNDWRRGYQRRVETDEPDVVPKGKATRSWFKFWSECKNTKAPNIVKAYHQALEEQKEQDELLPALVFSKKTNDPSGWLVTMDLKLFIKFLELWKVVNEHA